MPKRKHKIGADVPSELKENEVSWQNDQHFVNGPVDDNIFGDFREDVYVYEDNSDEDDEVSLTLEDLYDNSDDDDEDDSEIDDEEEGSEVDDDDDDEDDSEIDDEEQEACSDEDGSDFDQEGGGSSEIEEDDDSDVGKSEEDFDELDDLEEKVDESKVEVENKVDEYKDHDTSDEEDIRNTVGKIPMHWYDEYKHVGYDWDGKKITKPVNQNDLDMFLKKIDDPEFWRTVKDPQTGLDVVLSDDDVKLIRRIKEQKIPDESFDDYAPWIEWFTSEVEKMPLRKFPDHKRSFLPSRHEARQVSKLVHALKMGWIKTKEEQDKLRAKKEPQFYMLWQTDDQAEDMRRIHKHIPAPKRRLPGHAESYNPPSEYLFDEREIKQWNKQKTTPWKRKLHFVPEKYDSLRRVPAYPRYIKERFLRCLDLYLCPRAIKMKLTIEPDALVPKFPSLRDMQPFPAVLAMTLEGHTDMVRSIDTDKSGRFLVSGSDDCTIKIWSVDTGRCRKTIKFDGIIRSVKWCPNTSLSLILVATDNKVVLVNPHVHKHSADDKTDSILKDYVPQSDRIISDKVRNAVEWTEPNEEEYEKGYRIILKHFKEVTQVTWHGKGDYFASVMTTGQDRSVLINKISNRHSQFPTSKAKGLVQFVLFHPSKPFLFVATQTHIRIYNLVKQVLVKKLLTNSKYISSMDIHPGGDNLIVGTYDRKVLWFDLELSTKPYQTMKYHNNAVRTVAFHRRYPLFASGSDDTSMVVSHGMVYNQLDQNAFIRPLKRLKDHKLVDVFGIFSVHFHPILPWVFTAGADNTIKLYSN